MSQQESLTYGPEHRACEVNVEAPTICVDERGKSICVQWFGQPAGELLPNVEIPDGAQFLFPLLVSKDSIEFTLLMEGFMVIFLAPVKDWPADPSAVQQMIDGPGNGDENTWLIWAMNPMVGLEGGKCPSPCVRIALLGDPNCGVIVPQPFIDLGVRDEVLAKLKET